MGDPVETSASEAAWPKGISAITLFVEELSAAKLFYQVVFGLPVYYEDDASAVFQFGNTLINLLETTAAPELIEPARVASREAGAPPGVYHPSQRRRYDVRSTGGARREAAQWSDGSAVGHSHRQLYGPRRPHLGDRSLGVANGQI